MRRHLAKSHDTKLQPAINQIRTTATYNLQQLYTQAEITNQSIVEFEQTILRKYLNREIIDEALVSLIVICNLPFSAVEWPEFHIFCQTLNSEVSTSIITTYTKVSKKIQSIYNISKDII